MRNFFTRLLGAPVQNKEENDIHSAKYVEFWTKENAKWKAPERPDIEFKVVDKSDEPSSDASFLARVLHATGKFLQIRQANPDLTPKLLQILDKATSTSSTPELNSGDTITPSAPINRMQDASPDFSGAIKSPLVQSAKPEASYLESASQTFSDAATWLSEKLGTPYDVVVFTAASALTRSPLQAALITAAASSAVPRAGAVMIGDEDYETTVFCGPEINCQYLRDLAEEGLIGLSEQSSFIESNFSLRDAKRIILYGHGDGGRNGAITISKDGEMSYTARPDYIAKIFFTNPKVIHAVGCAIGANFKKNFESNTLDANQVLFLHAGENNLTNLDADKILPRLILNPNNRFPTQDLKIIFKQDDIKTIFAELNLFSLERAALEIADAEGLSRDEIINKLYDSIAQNVNEQKQSVFNALRGIPEKEIRIINAELERMGFVDYTAERDLKIKEEFVRDYLSKQIFSAHSSSISSSLDPLLRYDLIDRGFHLVEYVARNDDIDSLEVLYRHGIDLNKRNEDSESRENIAVNAVVNKQWRVLKYLGEHGVDFNEQDVGGSNIVHIAIQNGSHDCLKVCADLHKSGKQNIDFDKEDITGATPLEKAVMKKDLKSLKILLENGANPIKPGTNGFSPLIYASKFGMTQAVELLADHLFDRNQINEIFEGATAIEAAIVNDLPEVVKVLAKKGANLDLTRSDGNTPVLLTMLLTIENLNLAMVKVLVDSGANPNKGNPLDGKTPLAFAISAYQEAKTPQEKQTCKEIAIYLVQKGADPALNIKVPGGMTISANDLAKFFIGDEFVKEMEKARQNYLIKEGKDKSSESIKVVEGSEGKGTKKINTPPTKLASSTTSMPSRKAYQLAQEQKAQQQEL